MQHVLAHRMPWRALVVLAALLLAPPSLSAQTLSGRLLDGRNGRPIDLGIMVLFTEEGDSVGLGVTTPEGRFSITAPEPGSFFLIASAWGYPDHKEGVFDLGEGASMEIEFRISPRPVELDEILVSVDAPLASHRLVRNGFVSRVQRGIGHFITPAELERSPYPHTESLFHMTPGVRVVPSRSLSVTGDYVLLRGMHGWCMPTLYIDDIRTPYRPEYGESLSALAPIDWIEAVEIYRGPSEVPPQYGGTDWDPCGAIVIWLKR